MNPWGLSASDLLVWGIVLHLIADWPLQNDWMANHKALRRHQRGSSWWDRHPAAYVHSGIHGLILSFIFGWVAIPLALSHFLIDCRWIVVTWSRFIRQTQPQMMYDIGFEVRFWTDQVFHITCIALAALLVMI